MQLNRVVITGMGAVSPFGPTVNDLLDGLDEDRSAVQYYEALREVQGLRSLVASQVSGIDPKQIARKHRRSMSRLSIYATLAAKEALAQGAVGPELYSSGQLGVAAGSTVGSTETIEAFFKDYFLDHSLERMKSTLFFKIMNHSCASNIAQTFDISGRILAPSAACATGSQAIGYGYEMIVAGHQQMMLCGGADELHPLTCATFDVMHAASTQFNDRPQQTPRPFDADRDGMVCGEGSGILLLESLDSALNRGVEILGEVVGFATLSDPGNIANPDSGVMAQCMRQALAVAEIEEQQIDYVNAHATATEQGDIAESQAIATVFDHRVAVSSLKGHLGHTMAASGALETISTVDMLRRGRLVPTLHLQNVDPRCADLNYVRARSDQPLTFALKNNFALGGVNTSLVLRRYDHD
ncbi:MAG: beta-ketoacyl-[acyl-carrier-protein] synthase family protein [Desulfuromonas sp.]|nr:beta-ketoacyl-[acyl-carrier-protein] synthase family protein [Desulfuromonas sp.]